MNQMFATILALGFLFLVFGYNLVYIFINLQSPRIAKKWLWVRGVLSLISLLAAVAFTYIFVFAR